MEQAATSPKEVLQLSMVVRQATPFTKRLKWTVLGEPFIIIYIVNDRMSNIVRFIFEYNHHCRMDPQLPPHRNISQQMLEEFRQVFKPGDSCDVQQQSEDEEGMEEEFLDRVDELLTDQNSDNLEMKVLELQGKCSALALMNQSLMKRLEEEDKHNDDSSFEGDNSAFIQNQFLHIEQTLSSYRSELSTYQSHIIQQKQQSQSQIKHLHHEIADLEDEVYRLQKSAHAEKTAHHKTQKQNHELMAQVHSLEKELSMMRINRKYSGPYDPYESESDRRDHSCMLEMEQMEQMVERLAEELQYERDHGRKLASEVKRLTAVLKRDQKSLKSKNKQVFKLQQELIDLKKQIVNECSVFEDPSLLYKSAEKEKNRNNEYYSSNRRLSGLMDYALKRDSCETSLEQVHFRNIKNHRTNRNSIASLKMSVNSNGKNRKSNRYQSINTEEQQESEPGSVEILRTQPKLQRPQKTQNISTIPIISSPGLALIKFLTTYIYPQHGLLQICKAIIRVFEGIDNQCKKYRILCMPDLQVYDLNPAENLKVRCRRKEQNLCVTRENMFHSVLAVISGILEDHGRQLLAKNDHLGQILEQLQSAKGKMQKFTYLSLAINQSLFNNLQ